MGKLGFDIKLSDMTEQEIQYAHEAVANYHRLHPVIGDGDMYRLISPYEQQHAATQFVSKDRRHSVLFAFDIHPRFGDKLRYVKFRGLDPALQYRVNEINLMPGQSTWVKDRTYSGDFLMTVGLDILSAGSMKSRVVEVVAQ